MSIDAKTIDGYRLGSVPKISIDVTEQKKQLDKAKQIQTDLAHQKELSLLTEIEKTHYEDLMDKGNDAMNDNKEAYFKVIGIDDASKLDDVMRISCEKRIMSIIDVIAQNTSKEHTGIQNKTSDFLARINPESLKNEYIKAKAYLDRMMAEGEKEEMERVGILPKNSGEIAGTAKNIVSNDAFVKGAANVSSEFNLRKMAIPSASQQNNNSNTPIYNYVASTIVEGKYNQAPTYIASSKKEELKALSNKESSTSAVSKTFDEMKSQARSPEEQNLLAKMQSKIDAKTGEMKSGNDFYIGEGNELKLSPDGKMITLSGLGFEYKYANPLNRESLVNIFNKSSSILFLDKTGITCLNGEHIKTMFKNINKFNSNGIPLDMDKRDGLSQSERIILLATLKKLDLISSYDPQNLSKKISSKQEFEQKLNSKTNFYKEGVFSAFNFENTIAALAKKPANAAESVVA